MHRILLKIAAGFFALLAPAAAFADDPTLKNPTQFNDLSSFLAAFLKAIVQISLPILTLFIVYSGFLFVIARGNPAALAKAKRNLLYVILASILILGAWMLATLLGATVSNVVGT